MSTDIHGIIEVEVIYNNFSALFYILMNHQRTSNLHS